VPIGSAGLYAAMAKASRRRLEKTASMTPAVTDRVRSVPSAGSRSRRDGRSQ
jgi:hypothetical protein